MVTGFGDKPRGSAARSALRVVAVFLGVSLTVFGDGCARGRPPTLSDASIAIVARPGGQRLAEPQSLPLSGASVPYGSRVRVAVRAQDPDGDLVLLAVYKRLPDAYLQHGLTEAQLERGIGHQTLLLDHDGRGDVTTGDGIYSCEFVMPIDTGASVSPGVWPSGPYILRLCGIDAAGNKSALLNISVKLEPQPLGAGSPPVIEKAWTDPPNVSGPPGTPYLVKARVRDPDGDVMLVEAELWEQEGKFRMVDNGTWGDEVAGDGVFTRARVIRDSYDASAPSERQKVHMVVQAFDTSGKSSDYASAAIDAHYDESNPLLSKPPGEGPKVLDIWPSAKVIPTLAVWRVTARADRPDVWLIIYSQRDRSYDLMLDDGFEWDAKRGDGVYSWGWYQWHPGVERYTVYAIPKSGTPATGAKQTVSVKIVRR